MENILLCLSNFTAYFPITKACNNGDIITSLVLGFVAGASVVSHLFESHKHGMSGFGIDAKVSYMLNRFDVLGCVLVALRAGYLYWYKYGLSSDGLIANPLLTVATVVALALNAISEHDKDEKKYFILTHTLWHLSIFIYGYYWLDILI